MYDFSATVVGNLVADPRLRVVDSGAAVCSFRLGVTPRRRDPGTGQWVDGTSMFVGVSAWRTLAEHAQASLHKGDRVVVSGRVREHSYTTQHGEVRIVWEIDADMVAPDLARHTAVLARPARNATAVADPAGQQDAAPAETPAQGQTAAA